MNGRTRLAWRRRAKLIRQHARCRPAYEGTSRAERVSAGSPGEACGGRRHGGDRVIGEADLARDMAERFGKRDRFPSR